MHLDWSRINNGFSSPPSSRIKFLHANCIMFGRARSQALPNHNRELIERLYN